GGGGDVLVVRTPMDGHGFDRLLGEGSQWGVRFSYAEQPKPNRLAEAFIICADFIGRDRVAMVLGDNIFFGHGLSDMLTRASGREQGGTIFAYHVPDPERY